MRAVLHDAYNVHAYWDPEGPYPYGPESQPHFQFAPVTAIQCVNFEHTRPVRIHLRCASAYAEQALRGDWPAILRRASPNLLLLHP